MSESQIPRIDPLGRLPLEAQAARAMNRFVQREGFLPEDLQTAKFRAIDQEPEVLIKRIGQLLKVAQSIRTPEQVAVIAALKLKYGEARSLWDGKVDMANAPTKQDVSDWIDTLSGLTLDGIGKFKETARLVLCAPGVTAPEQIKMINEDKKIPGRNNSEINWSNVQVYEWRFGITDGCEDMPFDPDIYHYTSPAGRKDLRTNEEQLEAYEAKFAAEGLTVMPQHGILPSAMDALARGKVLDRKFITFFKRPKGSSLLPYAFWYNNSIGLFGGVQYDSYTSNFRCRPWVEGRKKV